MTLPQHRRHPTRLNLHQKKKTKCEFCRKKSLILVICKCGLQTCLKHKDPETHCCVYNFKADLEIGEKCEFAKLIKINE